MIKHLVDFSTKLFKEAILYWVLALDLIGLLTTYFTNFHVPSWIFWALPILAIFLGSFNIYRRGAADIRIIFRDLKAIKFEHTGGHEELTQMFTAIIQGHLVNYGLHAGVLEEISFDVGVNGIYDEFVIKHLNLGIEFSPLLKNTQLSVHSSYKKSDEIELPFVINAGFIQPFSLKVVFYINSYIQSEIEKTIAWLKQINFIVRYDVRQHDGVRNHKAGFALPTSSLEFAAEASKKSREKFSKLWNQPRNDT
jgi:hypothetical protein